MRSIWIAKIIDMKIDLKTWIGYILFVATVIGWAISYGKSSERIKVLQENVVELRSNIEELTDMMMSQQQLIGGLVMYMELKEKDNE